MFKNYITIAIRNLTKNKLFAIINIGGLALALAASILIMLFVRYETGFENWLKDSNSIYRIETEMHFPGREPMEFSYSPGPMKGLLEKEFPGEIAATTWMRNERTGVAFGDRRFIERVSYVNSTFFEVFDLQTISGAREGGLQDTSSVLISERMAGKYFGSQNPVGKTLVLDNQVSVRVAGVFENIPDNSHLVLDFLMRLDPVSYKNAPWVLERWGSVNLFTYFRLREGASIKTIQAGMKEALNRNANFGPEGAPEATPSDHLFPHFISVKDIHLFSSRVGNMKPGGSIATVLAFGTIAALILVIAGVNFTNLSTARALKRAGEVGVRKVLGASRGQLVRQFLGEAVLVSFTGLIVALILVEISVPWFQGLLGLNLQENWFLDSGVGVFSFFAAVFVGIGGGLFPALFLSSMKPKSVLEPGTGSLSNKGLVGNFLVGFQFSISISLIIMTLIVARQTEFVRNADLGFATEDRIIIRGMDGQAVRPVAETIRQEIALLPGVKATAFSHDAPPLRNDIATRTFLPDSPEGVLLERMIVGPEFFDLYEIGSVAGRLFGKEFRGDFLNSAEGEGTQFSVVLNHSGVRFLGFSKGEDAIGKTARMEIAEGVFGTATIVGVVDDIKLRSLHRSVTPMAFWVMDRPLNYLTVHLAPGIGEESTLAEIDRIWQQLAPEAYLGRISLSDHLFELYLAEEQAANIFAYFALFAILVSAMGLFGLAGYSTEQRTKEIGIRKVFGARVQDIVGLFLWQFSKPVLWATFIALPISVFLATNWLENFAYRIDLGAFEFFAAVVGVLFVSWFAVSFNAIKAAQTLPIQALRYE